MLAAQPVQKPAIEATTVYSMHDKVNYGYLAGIASYKECITDFSECYPELVDELCKGQFYKLSKQAKNEFWNIVNPKQTGEKSV